MVVAAPLHRYRSCAARCAGLGVAGPRDDRDTIRAFPSGQRLLADDGACSRGRTDIGNIIEARSSTGAPLYRLRLNTSRTALLGGHGGIPRGTVTAGYPGNVGPAGTQAAISGVPVQ